MADGDADLPKLAYGRRPRRGRRVIAFIVVAVMLTATTYLVVRWYRPQWTDYRGQLALESSIAPPGSVLFSDDPADVAALTGQPYYERWTYSPAGPAVVRKSAWRPFREQPRSRFQLGVPPIGLRRVPSGPWRVIHITFCDSGTQSNVARGFLFPTYTVWSRATLRPGTPAKQLSNVSCPVGLELNDRVTLRAGRLDPADESHFTLDYTINGVPDTIDCYLGANDKLTFGLRSGPMTRRTSMVLLRRPPIP